MYDDIFVCSLSFAPSHIFFFRRWLTKQHNKFISNHMRFTKKIFYFLFYLILFLVLLFSLSFFPSNCYFVHELRPISKFIPHAICWKNSDEHSVWFGFDSISIWDRRTFIAIEQQSKVLLEFRFFLYRDYWSCFFCCAIPFFFLLCVGLFMFVVV